MQLVSYMLKRSLILMLALGAVLHTPLSAQEYEYKVKYSMVNAGTARLVLNAESDTLSGALTIASSPWLSNLWTLSDSIFTEYDLNQNKLISHFKAIHEGNYHRRYNVAFLDSGQVLINGKSRIVDEENLRDIPSLIHELAGSKFYEGDTLRYRLWDGRGLGDLVLLVQRKKGRSLFSPLSDKSGWELIPLSSTRKSRENEIKLSIHLSQDIPHLPEKIEIDTKFGAVQMKLVDP